VDWPNRRLMQTRGRRTGCLVAPRCGSAGVLRRPSTGSGLLICSRVPRFTEGQVSVEWWTSGTPFRLLSAPDVRRRPRPVCAFAHRLWQLVQRPPHACPPPLHFHRLHQYSLSVVPGSRLHLHFLYRIPFLFSSVSLRIPLSFPCSLLPKMQPGLPSGSQPRPASQRGLASLESSNRQPRSEGTYGV
jgi:hypothetical protein